MVGPFLAVQIGPASNTAAGDFLHGAEGRERSSGGRDKDRP